MSKSRLQIAAVTRLLQLIGLCLALSHGTAQADTKDILATKGRGQDWPFFCRVNDEQSFRVVDNGAGGYTMTMYYRGHYDGEMPVYLGPSDDETHWVVYGREHLGPFRDRQVLALINKHADDSSHADVRTTRRNAETSFELQPIACGSHEQRLSR